MEEYINEINKMCWSYSRLSSFEHCKYCFYLKYLIDNNDEYLAEGNYYAEVGKFVHEILAMIFEGKLTPDEATQYFVDNYDTYVCYKVRESIMDKTFESCANYFANVDFSWLNDYEILGVELEVRIKIKEYEYVGFIDLLLKHKQTGKIIIVDHKSASYPFKKDGKGILAKSKDSFESYKKQMYLYSHVVKEMFGEFPEEICWNHFKEEKVASIPFDMAEYENAIKWFVDTIREIEKEEDYEPTIDYFYCSNLCDFRNCCEYRKYKEEVQL